MGPINILVADDHESFRRTLRRLIDSHAGWSVCGEAADGVEAVERARELRPDIVLMDMSMPRMDGAEATRKIREHAPGTRVVIVSQNDPNMMRKVASASGAHGFVSKTNLTKDLVPEVARILALPRDGRGEGAERGREWFFGDGELFRLIRDFDWSQTPLGAIREWPQSLRTAVNLMVNSQHPMWIGWGPQRTFLYNDAYISVLSLAKHPWALGRPASKVWAEIWDVCGPLADKVFSKGEPSFLDDVRLFMNRGDYLEETYYSFSYSPIYEESGEVGGLFCPSAETTAKVLHARKLRTLSELSAKSLVEKTTRGTCESCIRIISQNPNDIPFALLYLLDADKKKASLEGTSHVQEGVEWISPATIDLTWTGENCVWPLRDVVNSAQPVVVSLGRIDSLPLGPAGQSVREAIVLPVTSLGMERPFGVLIAGVNPTKKMDVEYRTFFSLVADQVATALQNASAVQREKARIDALVEIDRAKTMFFSNVSHEFRTPLTLMLAPLEEMLSEASVLTSRQRERLDIAHRNSVRLLKLVNTLLDFSRIEAGRIEASYEPTDLGALTSDLASVFQSATQRAGLRLIVNCPPIEEAVYVDREMWEKIVFNLLSNAVKFTFDGEIEVSLRTNKGTAELSVRDTGTGIPAEELPHLFERFYRVKGARGRTFEGSGIGLALVQELTNLHGGAVRVRSELDRGTTFTVAIPLGKAHLPEDRLGAGRKQTSTGVRGDEYVQEALRWLPEADDAEQAGTERSFPSAGASDRPRAADKNRALVVLADDNADMRDYVRRLLSEEYEVVAVGNGESALEQARARRPDLILSDIMMPRMDGFSLLETVRGDETLRGVPVILLSARAGEESRLDGLQLGADDYLVKPFSARELLVCVRSHLALAEIRRQGEEQLRRITAEAVAATAKFRAVFEQTTVFAGIMSKEGVLVEANRLCLDACGYQAEDVLGLKYWETGWWRNFPESREKIRAATPLAAQGIPYREILKYSWADGTERLGDFALYPIVDDKGEVLFLHPTGVDITDIKRTEDNYRELAERLEAEVQARTTELEKRNAEVLRQSELLRLFSQRVLRAQDEERRHIARELHDSAGQTLAVLGMNVAQLIQKAGRTAPDLAADAEELQETIGLLSRELRTTSYLLHPPLLDESGLSSALNWYVQGLSERSGLEIRLTISENFGRPPSDIELAVFRLVQESLTNIHRHSGSKTASIRIAREPGQITVEIADQGKGMSAERLAEIQSQASGVGIRGMRERLRQFDGNVVIESSSSGTRVFATIPVPERTLRKESSGKEPMRAVV